MSTTTAEHPLVPRVRAALHGVNDPEIRRPITELGMVDALDVDADGHARVRILLTVSGCPMKETLTRDVTVAVSATAGACTRADVSPTARAASTPVTRRGSSRRRGRAGPREGDIDVVRPAAGAARTGEMAEA